MRRKRLSPKRPIRVLTTNFVVAGFATLTACQPQAGGPVVDEQATPAVIYLVRHAEKAEENPSDPALSPEGQARAQLLVHLLADVDLDGVWSTDTRRTRNTAEPVAEAHGLSIELYDPRTIGDFANRLKEQGGSHLVVGHSNTTPGFVEALGGDPKSGIVEPEYDRFYIVTAGPDGHVETVQLQFGEPYVPAAM